MYEARLIRGGQNLLHILGMGEKWMPVSLVQG
jgi:hypothetical protein